MERMRTLNFRHLGFAFAIAAPWAAAVAVQGPSIKPKHEASPDTKVILEGMKAWRTPGGKFNAACSSCHSPDAFDLAQFNFSDATIQRRATAHVGKDDAAKIVAMVHAVRRKYGINHPLDSESVRPLQPGGEVLPGDKPADRDLAFGKSLSGPLPTLMVGRIDTLAKAQKARDEVLALDARSLKIGIPFNRWSEDLFHGDAHGTVADWVADLPCAPDPAKQKEWFEIVDRYVAEPTDDNLWKLYNAVPDHTKPFVGMPFATQFSYRKYTSMLIGQHLMRQRALGLKNERQSGRVAFSAVSKAEIPNPFWQLGEYAVLNEGLDSESQGMPEEVRPTLSPTRPFPSQMREIKAPWLWLGWLMDQGLQRTPGDTNSRNGRYFTLALYTDGGYALHNTFMITRKQLVQSYDPSALPEGQIQPYVFDFSELIAHRNAIRYEPQDPERQAMFRTMTGNALRMGMLLLIDETKRSGIVASKAVDEFQLEAAREYLIYSDPEHKAENNQLVDRALDSIYAAKDVSAK